MSKDLEGINLEGTAKDVFSNIDRMTGLSAPAGRAPRKKKAASLTSVTKSKAKGKEKAGTSESHAKVKGKEREVPTQDVPMDENIPETDNIDDIYMDE
jgi:hypothetical protein